MTRSLTLVALAALALTAPGCDLIDPSGPSFAGVVVDAVTEEPVEGIQMSLQVGGGGFGNYIIVAAVLTDAEGRFWLSDPRDRGPRPSLYVNSPGYASDQPSPYNPLYSGGLADYDFDDRQDIRVALRRLPN